MTRIVHRAHTHTDTRRCKLLATGTSLTLPTTHLPCLRTCMCKCVCVCVCIRLAHLVHTRPLSHNNIAVTQCQRYDKSTCTFFPPSTRASPYTHTHVYLHTLLSTFFYFSLCLLSSSRSDWSVCREDLFHHLWGRTAKSALTGCHVQVKHTKTRCLYIKF